MFDQELEVIDSYIEDIPEDSIHTDIWYLGRSIQLLSTADYFIGVEIHDCYYRGIGVEYSVAMYYNIPYTMIEDWRTMMPDVQDAINKHHEELRAERECRKAVLMADGVPIASDKN